MEIKEQLNQIRQLKIKLDDMELTLAEIRDRAIGQGSPELGKLNIMTSLPADPMAEAIIEYADMLDDYHELKRTYNKQRSLIMRTLKKYIDDIDALTMVVMRYVECKSFGEIGKQFGLDYRRTQSQIRWEVKQIDRKKNTVGGT